jgi:hypothetical protein
MFAHSLLEGLDPLDELFIVVGEYEIGVHFFPRLHDAHFCLAFRTLYVERVFVDEYFAKMNATRDSGGRC